VTLFAASSTTNAVEDVAKFCAEQTGHEIRTVFAASSALARQIENGAPADIYLSANAQWMDRLQAASLLVPDTRLDLLGNRLVLIANAEDEVRIRLEPGIDLAQTLKGTRLAVGDPAHVPAGIYAKEALMALDLWLPLEDKLAPASNVRAALALVERGEARLGIVYATDARISQAVAVVDTFPADSHSRIRYPIALIEERGTAEAREVLACFESEAAGALFEARGFTFTAAKQP
jgi:molybdate transport system substrate-binding protein